MRPKTWGLLATACAFVCGLSIVLAQVSQNQTVSQDGAVAPATAKPLDIGSVLPMPANSDFRPYQVGAGEVSKSATSGSNGSIVYSNRLGSVFFAPGGSPGALVADDIATLATEGCILDALRFRVSGDPLGDGSGAGPFSVDFALYSWCPSAGGFPLFPVVTVDFPDIGNYEVIYKPDPATEIEIPTNAYFGVSFSRSLAGIVFGAPATAGFSADRFDFPGTLCNAFFGGFPEFVHASFDLEITSRNDCPDGVCSSTCSGGSDDGEFCIGGDCPSGTCDGPMSCDGGTNADQACVYGCGPSYPAYKNSSQGGPFFTSEPVNEFFAEDITLAIPVDANNPCNLVSWEVGFKGQLDGVGAVQAELHTFLDSTDPENGGRIAGTRVTDIIAGTAAKVLKKTFATPIPITQQTLYVVFKTQNSSVGAIKTCKQADLGSTEDMFFVHDGSDWQVQGFAANCIAAFEVTLSCKGVLSTGACCDMALTENRTCTGGSRDGLACTIDSQCRVCVGGSNDGLRCDLNDCPGGDCPPEGEAFCIGDAVCRDLPEMNCAFPTLWREGESCGATCDGGAFDGEPCGAQGAGNPNDCPPACVGGLRDRQSCFSDPECPGVCDEASALAGNACLSDAECRTFPADTSLCVDIGTCGALGVCRGQFCFGGTNNGLPCSRSIDCPGGDCASTCMGGDNDGLPCLQSGDCPAGFCPATPFPEPCGLGTCCTSNDLRCCVTQRECHTDGTPCGDFNDPLETPVLFSVGLLPCDQGGCSLGACIGQVGDCTRARPGLCVGGALNGTDCDPTIPCFLDSCCDAGDDFCAGPGSTCIDGLCVGGDRNGQACSFCTEQPGCEDPVCCSAVCDVRLSCCTQHWTKSCADIAFTLPECQRRPLNDDCFGALFLSVNGSVEVDLANAQGGSSQPGLCCFRQESPGGPGLGSHAEATVWLRTIAPTSGTCRGGENDGDTCITNGDCDSGKCLANLSVDTCDTAGGGGDDSIIQVFSVGDQDSGHCDDLTVCSISAQDCADKSECVLDRIAACGSLSPVGCSDDAMFEGNSCSNGPTNLPFNSKVCVDVVPGDPYYIMVAAKDDAARGKYRVTISEFCSNSPPVLSNDHCSDAVSLGGTSTDFGCDGAGNCDEFFDLGGFGGAFAPATFDCPGSNCLFSMENDVWYDWTAPATGTVSADTCDGANTPDTSLVLYDGCTCPPEIGTELACSDVVLDPDCFLGSRVTSAVVGGQCYKFRLGGHFGGTPSGTLDIDFAEGCLSCQSSAPRDIKIPDSTGDNPLTTLTTNRTLIIQAGGDVGCSDQAIRVTFTNLAPPYDLWNGKQLWVGAPVLTNEAGNTPNPTDGSVDKYWAKLRCAPECRSDWGTLGDIHVYHEGIVPGSVYDIQVVDCTNAACLADESNYSSPLSLGTSIYGDTVRDCSQIPCPPPEGPPVNVADALAVLSAFSSAPGAPRKARVDIEPRDLDRTINVPDAMRVIEGFSGVPYPFAPSVADPCP